MNEMVGRGEVQENIDKCGVYDLKMIVMFDRMMYSYNYDKYVGCIGLL